WDVAHSMDEESFALLGETLERLRSARVVFLFAGRAGVSHPMETGPGHVGQGALGLGPLPGVAVERLGALRLGVDSVPEELMRFLRARAGGHPLFAEE